MGTGGSPFSRGPQNFRTLELLYDSDSEIPRSVSENPTLVPGSVITRSVYYGSDPEMPKSVFGPVSETPTLVFRGAIDRERAGSRDETVLPQYK
jgi:hypothetical protein